MDGVGNQRASETMQRAVLFGGADRGQHAVLLLKGDAVRKRNRELALRPLHVDAIALQRDLYAAGTGIGLRPIRDICFPLSNNP